MAIIQQYQGNRLVKDVITDAMGVVEERLKRIEERLLLIDPPADTLAKYPALAEAYREYKVIERLVLNHEKE